MNTKIQVFNHEQFGSIRTMEMPDGQIGFVGKDVAKVLGYNNTRKALIDHVEAEDKVVAFCDSLGGKQKTTFINESGLYSLILSSKLPKAKEFKHWVTAEVLPQIRKTGGYILLVQKQALADYAEEVLLSPTCYTMTEVAKSLSITVHELQHWLHKLRVIYRSPSGCWMLYADHLKKGYEAYRTNVGRTCYGNTIWTESYLVWTERGKEFIHNIFRSIAA